MRVRRPPAAPLFQIPGNYSVFPHKQGFIEMNGEWKMENGKWRMENGEWRMKLARKHRHSSFSIVHSPLSISSINFNLSM
jgi:hypothetical protein